MIRAITLILFAAGVCQADIYEATVRISRAGGQQWVGGQLQQSVSWGTGTVIRVLDDSVLILTNAHVAGSRGGRVHVEFWQLGHQSQKFPGGVIWSDYVDGQNRDLAIVQVRRDQLPHVPAEIPLAPRGTPLPAGAPVNTLGCPGGSWPLSFRGHITRQPNNRTVEFVPAPLSGRSGSALTDHEGQAIVGVVTWADDSRGLAQSVDAIYQSLDGTSRFAARSPAYDTISATQSALAASPLLPVQLFRWRGPGCWGNPPRGGRPDQQPYAGQPRNPTPAPQNPFPTMPGGGPPVIELTPPQQQQPPKQQQPKLEPVEIPKDDKANERVEGKLDRLIEAVGGLAASRAAHRIESATGIRTDADRLGRLVKVFTDGGGIPAIVFAIGLWYLRGKIGALPAAIAGHLVGDVVTIPGAIAGRVARRIHGRRRREPPDTDLDEYGPDDPYEDEPPEPATRAVEKKIHIQRPRFRATA